MITHEKIQGWYDWHNLAKRIVLNWIPQNGTYVELGVWYGKSLIAFGELCRQYGKNARLIGIDLFGGPQDDPNMDKMVANCGGSFFGITQRNLLDAGVDAELIRDDITAAARRFDDESIDVLLVDGMHKYENVKQDTLAWMPKLKFGGTILWHDADRPEVKQAIVDSWGKKFHIEAPRTAWARK